MVLLLNTALFVLAVKLNRKLIIFFPPTKYFLYLQHVLSCLFHLENSSGRYRTIVRALHLLCQYASYPQLIHHSLNIPSLTGKSDNTPSLYAV